ncbi:TetR/AcrR family transcriptional regulator [Nocardia inohanensis]|uniref:TetR/AcrR family transcriptional regulator n=1 Tax=Nocardia inohanensis TaxID=209246 RepID=UPI00082DF606|nr:TetR family transcriptional regulator [Nocardia inohanensis]
MPRLVDHEQRRREITTVARRVIAAGGLEAATFQFVAAEAGISVRLIQYYFGNKRELMLATLQAVVVDAGQRFEQRIAALGSDADPRAVIRAFASVLLPMDDQAREDALVLAAFHAAALTGSTVGAEDTAGPGIWLMGAFADQLKRHRASVPDGESRAEDVDSDAELLVFTLSGITQGVLTRHKTPEQAAALFDRLLDRLL